MVNKKIYVVVKTSTCYDYFSDIVFVSEDKNSAENYVMNKNKEEFIKKVKFHIDVSMPMISFSLGNTHYVIEKEINTEMVIEDVALKEEINKLQTDYSKLQAELSWDEVPQ